MAENLKKFYQMGEVTVKALKDASFELMEGEVVQSLAPVVPENPAQYHRWNG